MAILSLSGGAARQQQVGDVHAGMRSRKLTAPTRTQSARRALSLAIQLLAGDKKSDASVRPRIVFVKPGGEPFQIRSSGFERHPGREPADHGEFRTRTVGIGAVTERLIDLIVNPRLSGWEHTNDNAGSIVQAQRFADDIRISGKAASPKSIAETTTRFLKPFSIIGAGKVSAQYGRYAEKCEKKSTVTDRSVTFSAGP